MIEELRNLYALLDVYKEKQIEAIENNNRVISNYWQDNIRRIGNIIK